MSRQLRHPKIFCRFALITGLLLFSSVHAGAATLDYFGIQAGNYFQSTVTSGQSVETETDDISLDTTTFSQPSFLDSEVIGRTAYQGWYQVLSNGLFTPEISSSGMTITLNPPLPLIETPLAPGKNWTGSSNVQVDGVTVTFTATGTVPARAPAIVTVPAGTFLAWPVTYTLTGSSNGRNLGSQTFTQWFAPYIGTVYSVESGVTTQLTSFAVGGGTVTVPPPVITSTSPASGNRGSELTINGFQFGAAQGASSVRIGNVACGQILSWSDNQIQCTIPQTVPLGVAAVTVVTDTWTSNNTINFTVQNLPQPTSLTPSWGKCGSLVRINGMNFGKAGGTVHLGNTKVRIIRWTDTSITFAVPGTMPYGSYTVTVANSYGQSSLPGDFTVENPDDIF